MKSYEEAIMLLFNLPVARMFCCDADKSADEVYD